MVCPFCSKSCSSVGTGNPNCPYGGEPLLDATTEVILDLRRKCIDCDEAAARKAKGIYHWSNVPSGQSISDELAKKYPCFGGRNSGYAVCPFCGSPLGGSSSSYSSRCGGSTYQAPQYPTYVPPPPQKYEPPQYPTYVPPPPQKYEPPQYPTYVPPPPQKYEPPQYPTYVPPPPQKYQPPQYPPYVPQPQQPYQPPQYPPYRPPPPPPPPQTCPPRPVYRPPPPPCQQRSVSGFRGPCGRPAGGSPCGGFGGGSNKIQQALQHIDAASRILKSY